MITSTDRAYLRELAKRQKEISNLPVMAERERRWFRHNSLEGGMPMIVMEEETFINDLLPKARCETPEARQIERQLQTNIAVHEQIDDDKVIPSFFTVSFPIHQKLLGQEPKLTRAATGSGFHIDPLFETLEEGLEKLRPSTFSLNAEKDKIFCGLAEDVIGDILPIKRINSFNFWNFGITHIAVSLMGMENMYCAMMAEAENFHRFMNLITEDRIRCLRWQEKEGLLRLNNGNDYMGSGSYCFTKELPRLDTGEGVRSTDTWGHLNSQESVGLSPAMYKEFIYPYYERLAKEFGLVYYGCCESVHTVWDDCLSGLPGLRKVSISPWCDEALMAERLKNGRIIYSRKPSPNFIGIEAAFDEEAFSAAMRHTAKATRDCHVEVIFRDIYTLCGNLGKVRRAVDLARQAFADQ